MSDVSGTDVVLLMIAAYISIVALVRLMQRRRDEVLSRLQVEIAVERKRKQVAERQRRSVRAQAAGSSGPVATANRKKPGSSAA
jgi:hypothetical protein